MKKNLFIFPVIGAMLLTLCLAGCDKTPDPTVPSDSNIESTSPSTTPDNTNDTDNTTPGTDNNSSFIQNADVAMGTQFVWAKEHQVLNANNIYVDSNWSSYIVVDGNKIMANQMTDASVLNNYFYNENKLAIIDDMKMAYELDWRDFYVRAETVAPNQLANGEFIIRGSSYPSQSKVLDTYNRNLIIHTVQYNSYAAEFEEILNALREIKVEHDGAWGIGSTYEDVVSIMGEPTVEFAENVFEHSMLITATYTHADCSMTITFFTDNVANKGFVIGLTWNASSVSDQLYSQDGYESFYSGLYSEIDFFEIVEDTTNEESSTTTEPTTSTESSDSSESDIVAE